MDPIVTWNHVEEVLGCGNPQDTDAIENRKRRMSKLVQTGWNDGDSVTVYTSKKETGSGGSNKTNPNQGDSPSPSFTDRIWEKAGMLCSAPGWNQVYDVCSTAPCQPLNLFSVAADNDDEDPVLGITALVPPQGRKPPGAPVGRGGGATISSSLRHGNNSSSSSSETPADRRRQRHAERTKQKPRYGRGVDENSTSVLRGEAIEVSTSEIRVVSNGDCQEEESRKSNVPFDVLEVKSSEAQDLERSISELTMRSCHATSENSMQKMIPDNRRMAYYAVGKHHRQSGRGGNRRCYFTGKLILGGAPFYAGTVQQGLRTLVVFCLPSALGLPDKEILEQYQKRNPENGLTSERRNGSISSIGSSSRTGTILSVHPNRDRSRASHGSGAPHPPVQTPLRMDTQKGHLFNIHPTAQQQQQLLQQQQQKRLQSHASGSVASKSWASKHSSRLSSLDDLSLSIDGDLDPNWGLDRDVLLAVLPPAAPALVHQMAELYPDQFETLPMQVRSPKAWKLYVKFCFFSGLPIADGELHYKLRDDVAEQAYFGEEITLSHEVLEASTGQSSAEILTLPNRIVLRYIQKHYAQQCNKLNDQRTFQRASWERISPEI